MKGLRRAMAIAIGVGLILASAFFLVGRPLLTDLLLSRFNASLRGRLGIELAARWVGGTGLVDLDLRGVRVKHLQGADWSAEFERVRFVYPFTALLRGEDALAQRLSLELTGGRVEIVGLTDGPPQPFPDLPVDLPPIRVRNLDVAYRYGALLVAASDLNLALARPVAGGAGQPADFRVGRLAVSHSLLARPLAGALAGRLRYAGPHIELHSLRLGGEKLPGTAKFEVTPGPAGALTVDADLRPPGGALVLHGRFPGAGGGELSGRLDDLDLSRSGLLLAAGGGWRGKAGGRFACSYGGERPLATMRGEANLTLRGVAGPWVAPFDAELAATVGAGQLRLPGLRVMQGGNRLRADDVVVPLDALARGRASILPALTVSSFEATLVDLPALAEAMGRQRSGGKSMALPVHRLHLRGGLAHATLTVAKGSLESEVGGMRIRHAALGLQAGGISGQTPLTVRGEADIVDLARFAALFGQQGVAGRLRGKIDVTGTVAAPRGQASLAGSDLSYRGVACGGGTFELGGDGKRILVRRFELRHGADRLTGSGTLLLANHALEELSWSLKVGELADYLPLFPAVRLPLRGAMRMQARAWGAFDNPAAQAVVELAGASWQGLAVPAASVTLRLADGAVTVDPAVMTTSFGEIAMAGRIVGIREGVSAISLDRLRLSRPGMDMRLAAPVRLARDAAGGWPVGGVALVGAAGRFTLDGRVTPAGPLDLRLGIADAGFDGLFDGSGSQGLTVRGVDGSAHLGGTARDPSLTLTARVRELRSPLLAVPLAGRLRIDCSRQGITVREFAFTAPRQSVTASGHLPYDLLSRSPVPGGSFGFSAAAELADLRNLAVRVASATEVRGTLKAALTITGDGERPVGRLRFACRDLELPPAIRPRPPGPLAMDVDLEATGDRLRVHGLSVRASGLAAELGGFWLGAPSPADLAAGVASLKVGTLDLNGRLEVEEIGWLADMLPGVRRLGGTLRSTFRVSGSPAAPELRGTASLAGGEVRFVAAVPPVRELAFRLAFDRNTVQIIETQGLLGGAPFTLAGQLRHQGRRLDLDLALHGKDILFLRNEGVTVRGDADLAITGPLERVTMSGDVRLTGGSYRRNVDFLSLLRGAAKPGRGELTLFSLTEPPFRDAVLRIRLHAEQPLAVNNNLVRGAVRPEVVLSGTCEAPFLTGAVYVEPTRITLPAGRLNIESGKILFPQQDPGRPTFDLLARSRLAGHEVTMLLQGNVEAPVITLSSVPPLPEEQLLLLVLTGRPPQAEGGRHAGRKVGMKMALYLGKGLLADWFGRGDEADEAILDRFDLDVGRDVTRQGQDTLEARFRMAEGVLLPGDRLYINSERDFFDDYNAGVRIVFRFR